MIFFKTWHSVIKSVSIILLIVLISLSGCQQKTPYTIYLAGDSTLAEKKPEKSPETGWGMKFQEFFSENVTIANHAKNGRSTKSFIAEGRWDSIITMLQPNDYVFIQFGHNDQGKTKIGRYTPPDQFYENLCRFVDDVRSKDATPVLLTPVMRRRFDENGQFYDVHGEYPDITRKAAKDKEAYLLDMHKLSEELLIEYGEEHSKDLFLIAAPGVWNNYPEGIDDNTHFNEKGALEMAKLAVEAIKASDLPIKSDLTKENKE